MRKTKFSRNRNIPLIQRRIRGHGPSLPRPRHGNGIIFHSDLVFLKIAKDRQEALDRADVFSRAVRGSGV